MLTHYRLAPDRATTTWAHTPMSPRQPQAVGVVHSPAGTPALERLRARGLVVRHSRDARLRLVDIVDLDDDLEPALRRIAELTTATSLIALVTSGVRPELAQRLAHDLGLRHEPVPERWHQRRSAV